MVKFLLIVAAIFVVGYILFEFVIPFILMLFSWLVQLLSWALWVAIIGALIIGAIWLLYEAWLYYNDKKDEKERLDEQAIVEHRRYLLSELKESLIKYLNNFQKHVDEQKQSLIFTEQKTFMIKQSYIYAANRYYDEKESEIDEKLQDLNYIFQKYLAEQTITLGEMKQVTRNQQVDWDRRLEDLKQQNIGLLASEYEEKYTPEQWVIWEENPVLKKIYNKTPERSMVPWGASEDGDIRYEYVNKRNNIFKIPEKQRQTFDRTIASYLTDLYDVFDAHTKRFSMTIIGDDEAGTAQKVIERLEKTDTPFKFNQNALSDYIEERKTEWENDFTNVIKREFENNGYLFDETNPSMFYEALPAYEIVVFFFDQYTSNDDLKSLDDMNVKNRFLPIIFYHERHEEQLQRLERYESLILEVKNLSLYEPMRKVETNE